MGHQFLQTPDGNLIKVEHDTEIDFEDNIIYRYAFCGLIKMKTRKRENTEIIFYKTAANVLENR